MAAHAIEAAQLTKTFPGGLTAVKQCDLRVRSGSVFGLIGPNGAGKTTLLRLLVGLLQPESGSARVLGHDLWEAPRSVRSRVAYISQSHQLPSWMTLEELCLYASRLYEQWDSALSHSLAERWRVPLRQRVGYLSVGEQRKAALILAFAARPEVLILDEPAAGLDPIARRGLVDQIIDLISSGDGCTVLLSTHLLDDLERVVDSVGIMDAGRLLLASRLDDLLNSIKRVQVVFDDSTVPPGFTVPGALWSEATGSVLTALVSFANEAQLDSIRHWPSARVQVFPMRLEEILLAYLGREAAPRLAPWT